MKIPVTKLDKFVEQPKVQQMRNSKSKSIKNDKHGRKKQKPRTIANRGMCIAF